MSKCVLQPMEARVVVERVEAETMTPGGIALPDNAKEKPTRGVVKAVGLGKMLDNGDRSTPQVKMGDEILFTSYAGTEVKVGQEEFVIISESDVLAVVKEN